MRPEDAHYFGELAGGTGGTGGEGRETGGGGGEGKGIDFESRTTPNRAGARNGARSPSGGGTPPVGGPRRGGGGGPGYSGGDGGRDGDRRRQEAATDINAQQGNSSGMAQPRPIEELGEEGALGEELVEEGGDLEGGTGGTGGGGGEVGGAGGEGKGIDFQSRTPPDRAGAHNRSQTPDGGNDPSGDGRNSMMVSSTSGLRMNGRLSDARQVRTAESTLVEAKRRESNMTRVNGSGNIDVTLAHSDCHLHLEGSVLIISWEPPDSAPQNFTVDLNQFIGVAAGQVVWGDAANFPIQCDEFKLSGTVVHATARIHNTVLENSFDLNYHIAYTPAGGFAPVLADPEFSTFMSTVNWMNFTVIGQANMEAFLKNPALQKAVAKAAKHAVMQGVNELRAHMEEVRSRTEKVMEALESIEMMTERRIQHQMETLVRTSALSSAIFGQHQLAMMMPEQRWAYNSFASQIIAPPTIQAEEW
ncbi:hypothetical protein C8R45DRAFT_1224486 [Mycena sanguinolenta]|nr:hypothetical protein C8R45DRAFT_1224486 [Mycena sanguinolenta]